MDEFLVGAIAMEAIGGNAYEAYSFPVAVDEHFFILEPGQLVSVVVFKDDQVFYEIQSNEAASLENPFTDVEVQVNGTISAWDKETRALVFRVRPTYDGSVIFGTIECGDIEVRLRDDGIFMGELRVADNASEVGTVGVTLESNGAVKYGSSVPRQLAEFLIERLQNAQEYAGIIEGK